MMEPLNDTTMKDAEYGRAVRLALFQVGNRPATKMSSAEFVALVTKLAAAPDVPVARM